MKRHLTLFILSVCSVLLFQGCGEEGDSKDIDITIIPSSPTVQNSTFSIELPESTEESPAFFDVEGPWFTIQYKIVNNSSRVLQITTYVLEAEGKVEGGVTSKEYNPDFSLSGSDQIYLTGRLEPREELDDGAVWYFGGLPETTNFRYKATMTFTGFFLTEDNPETEEDEGGLPDDRFEKTVRFVTR